MYCRKQCNINHNKGLGFYRIFFTIKKRGRGYLQGSDPSGSQRMHVDALTKVKKKDFYGNNSVLRLFFRLNMYG
jgi:hypothetical protein